MDFYFFSRFVSQFDFSLQLSFCFTGCICVFASWLFCRNFPLSVCSLLKFLNMCLEWEVCVCVFEMECQCAYKFSNFPV